jgi:hypothetical protein
VSVSSVKTVGVMGDGRTYEYVVGLRAVTSTDGMTADFYPFEMKFLGETATRIINEVKGVNRVRMLARRCLGLSPGRYRAARRADRGDRQGDIQEAEVAD